MRCTLRPKAHMIACLGQEGRGAAINATAGLGQEGQDGLDVSAAARQIAYLGQEGRGVAIPSSGSRSTGLG